MRNLRFRTGAASTSKSADLLQRRRALQTELEAAGSQRDHDARASSFARSRQRAGVTARDDSELGRLADETSTGDAAIKDLRRQIESIDDELRRDRTDGLSGTGRRVASWLRRD